jgi:uncharacterized protein
VKFFTYRDRIMATRVMKFEWDSRKSGKQPKATQVTFTEAATVFADTFSVTIYDPDHSKTEERYIIIGRSTEGRLLMVAHMDRGDRIRIDQIRTRGL